MLLFLGSVEPSDFPTIGLLEGRSTDTTKVAAAALGGVGRVEQRALTTTAWQTSRLMNDEGL